jgi:hypothetical protein
LYALQDHVHRLRLLVGSWSSASRLGGGAMSMATHRRRRAGFLKRSLWFLFRRDLYRRMERANRVYRALAPICKPGVAEAAAQKYYREHTGNEDPRSIDDAILVAIYGERALRRKAGEEPIEG